MDSVIFIIIALYIIALTWLAWYYKDLANRDGFTGCYNKDWFMCRKNSKLVQLMKKTHKTGISFGLLFLDLDDFKSVNDERGHQFGDSIILGTVKAIKIYLIGVGGFVVKYGGDELIVVLTEVTSDKELRIVACKIVDYIECITRRTVSVGGDVFKKRYILNVNKFISIIDKKMYIAKSHKNGKHSQIYI